MKRLGHLIMAAGILLTAALATADEMKVELKTTGWNPRKLRARFETYGEGPEQMCFPEVGGFRFRLPVEETPIPQTGVYSHFALASDCEVVCTYALLNLQPPAKGQGSGVGLAFDAENDVGRGSIQRVSNPSEENGYALHSSVKTGRGKPQEENRFVATTASWGRIGLRRIKKELVFLAADDSLETLQEIGRLPFTERTIRVVRLFADTGGASTAMDVRVRDIEVRAKEITDGVPQHLETSSSWWPWIVFLLIGLLGFSLWRKWWVGTTNGVGASDAA